MNVLRLMILVGLVIHLNTNRADAKTDWVELRVGQNIVRSLIALPNNNGPHPVVIYNHGKIVRKLGFNESADRGYDTSGYVNALADAGYMALAPIRDVYAKLDDESAISSGVETMKAAIQHLRKRTDVDQARIGVVGFSEGGLLTLWSAIEDVDFKAIVLMSPASMTNAGNRKLAYAIKPSNLHQLTNPIMLTVGAHDIMSIKLAAKAHLVPNLTRLRKPIEFKMDYPGDHKWFWKVRPQHFNDVTQFLDKYLK